MTDDDIGLKVLREPRGTLEAARIIECVLSQHRLICFRNSILICPSIIAIHGIGAHPKDTWCKNVGAEESLQWVNWLDKDDMLPAVAPDPRTMRYGYQSQWFGEGSMRQKMSAVARRLLLALRRTREVRSLRMRRIIIANIVRKTYFGR